MSRHRVFTLLVLSVLALVTACGSGTAASPSAVHVASVVRVGPYTQVFASPLPANPAQAAVVEGFREAEVLWEKSQNAGHLTPPVRDYVTGQALAHLNDALKGDTRSGIVPAGTDRLFMTHVTSVTGPNATVATCDDGSKFHDVNRHTGKVDTSFLPTPGEQYLFETWRMVKLGGHWAMAGFTLDPLPSRLAEVCQPGVAASWPAGQPSTTALLRGMTAALRAARSVHLSGTIQQGGKTLEVNLGITRSSGISGQFSENGAVLTILAAHGHSYLKVSATFLRINHLPASACSRLCGKYLELAAAQSRQLLSGLNLSSLFRVLARQPAGKVKYLGVVASGGQPAWLLQDSHGDSLYVATHGKPYILREVQAPPGEGNLALTQWNTVRIPGPPPASQVVNVGQLTG